MEKILATSFNFLEKEVVKVNCKSIALDSEQQSILTCDLYGVEELIYADKAYVLGTQPFELTTEEITELSK